MNTEQRYATTRSPMIEAVIGEHFKLKDEPMAVARMETIRNEFITSKQQIENPEYPSIVLWIKGYAVSDDEKKQGYIGNYAVITYKKTDDGKVTLYANKVDSELSYHPQKKRSQTRHPNWGHPILRSIQKGRIYESIDDARGELEQLHEEYPETSIPLTNKLYLMIYSRKGKEKPKVTKFVLEIEIVGEGEGYRITFNENNYEAQRPVVKKEEGPKEPPKGYFTAMVDLKRKK